MDVTKVKGMIQKLFKVGVADQQLFYISQKVRFEVPSKVLC